ncbi:hypothetical protein JYU34_005217 [Plutella xylostella]|uniref:Guanine deaminase n=1 Tax=Plutella xylostella TaxID=51655 RepID=A0ABQ7QW52_PLUXY|nr:hypothetical protein JYU34_005217 [Plutella xylostella]
MASETIYSGLIATSTSLTQINIFNGFITVENGKIKQIGTTSELNQLRHSNRLNGYNIVQLHPGQFLMPGLVDCHTHAPQFPNIGLGLDRPLLEWLDKYTFPLEKKYSDTQFAAEVYNKVVRRLLNNGTTTACYFGSLSLEGTLELVQSVIAHRQRALVGKVSMNRHNDAGYYNTTETEIKEVEIFVRKVLEAKNDLVQPAITPRFAVSCDEELMTYLSKIAQKYDCMIQSHISENKGEIQYVLETNPDSQSYSEVYDKSNILNNKCIMAHAVHLSSQEMALLSRRGVSVAHCAASNTRLMSGLCPLRRILASGINVGLGTDVSGGDSASILDAMRRAMDVSQHLQLQGQADAAISWREAFYLATLGGAKALSLADKIGSFEVGKEFDALLINVYKDGGPIDCHDYSVDTTETEVGESMLQKFIYLGDDRNIEKVYIKGVEVKHSL